VSSKSSSNAAETRGVSGADRPKAQAGTRRRRVRASQLSPVPPLQWWRRLPAHAFTTDHVSVLRRAFAGIGMVGEPRWEGAVHGHPAAAVGVALRIIKENRSPTPVVDLTMSTVLVAAIAGDQAAIMVLTMVIDRRVTGAHKDELKRSWLDRPRPVRHGRDASSALGARARIVSGD